MLSLTILDSGSLDAGVLRETSSVLVVTRSAANLTHPNVVSVPTQRIPQTLHDDVVRSADLIGDDPVRDAVYYRRGEVDSDAENGHHPTIFATEALLARKLGLGDALERGDVRFRAALRTRVRGVAVYDNLGEDDVYEPISMLNVVLAIDDGPQRLPLCTDSYSLAAWVPVAAFLAGVDAKDPSLISKALDPIEFCVHGVCLTAAAMTLEHLQDRPVFSSEPAIEADPLHRLPLTIAARRDSSDE